MSEVYRFVVLTQLDNDPRANGLLADGRSLGFEGLQSLECNDLYFIEGNVSSGDLERLARQLLSDPITQSAEWGRLDSTAHMGRVGQRLLEVALRPGVTDPVAEQIIRCAKMLGIDQVRRAATGV